MTPYEQHQELRRLLLPQLASRKEDLKRIAKDGPSKPEDYRLLVAVLNFALAEVSTFEGNKVLPDAGTQN